MRRPWNKYSVDKPWNIKSDFGTTRHHTPEYNTRRWQKLRRSFLNRYPVCAMCERIGKVTAANVVDHIVSIQNGGEFWNENNMQSLCEHCHRIKTNKEIAKRGNVDNKT